MLRITPKDVLKLLAVPVVIGGFALVSYYAPPSRKYGGNPNTAVLNYTKKCDPVIRRYLGPTGHKILPLAEYKAMSVDLTACVERQAHSAPTMANSRGGFGSWIPEIFKRGNNNEGK